MINKLVLIPIFIFSICYLFYNGHKFEPRVASYTTTSIGNTHPVELETDSTKLLELDSAAIEMFELVNQAREELGVEGLTMTDELHKIAEDYAAQIWIEKYFSHISRSGWDIANRLESGKVEFSFAGENLALAKSTGSAFDSLMKSDGHRKNILDETYTSVGVAAMENGEYGVVFVQVFTD